MHDFNLILKFCWKFVWFATYWVVIWCHIDLKIVCKWSAWDLKNIFNRFIKTSNYTSTYNFLSMIFCWDIFKEYCDLPRNLFMQSVIRGNGARHCVSFIFLCIVNKIAICFLPLQLHFIWYAYIEKKKNPRIGCVFDRESLGRHWK